MGWDATARDVAGEDTLQVFHLGAQLTMRMYEDPDDVKQVIVEDPAVALPIMGELASFVYWHIARAKELARVGKPHEDVAELERWLSHVEVTLGRARLMLADVADYDHPPARTGVASKDFPVTGMPAGMVPPDEKEA